MAKRRIKLDRWSRLFELIEEYAQATAVDAFKGGGDPNSIPVIEAELTLARAKVDEQVAIIRREYE